MPASPFEQALSFTACDAARGAVETGPILADASEITIANLYGEKNKRPGMNPTSHGHSALLPVHPWSAVRMTLLRRLKVVGRVLAGLAILDDVISDLLTIRERTHAGALYGRHVHEDIRAAIVRLNESEAFGGVKPLYSTSVHNDFLSKQSLWFPRCLAG
jgi:hypothetical protein